MPAALTTVPAVLLALVDLGRIVLPGSTFDGPPDVDNLPEEWLSIGWVQDEDEPAVDGSSSDDGNYTSSETYSVHCLLSVATGDTEPAAVAARRARAADLFTAFGLALRADPALDGTLLAGARATLGSVSWTYGPSEAGTFAEIAFDIDVTAAFLGTS